jgi:hypothetical protein
LGEGEEPHASGDELGRACAQINKLRGHKEKISDDPKLYEIERRLPTNALPPAIELKLKKFWRWKRSACAGNHALNRTWRIFNSRSNPRLDGFGAFQK